MQALVIRLLLLLKKLFLKEKLKKDRVHKAVVVRVKKGIHRDDGSKGKI